MILFFVFNLLLTLTSTQEATRLIPETVDEINVVEDKEASGSASADQVIPKNLQKILKNLNSRQRELYDNAPNDIKINYLEVIYEEKGRGGFSLTIIIIAVTTLATIGMSRLGRIQFPFEKVRDWLIDQNEWHKYAPSPKDIPGVSYDVASRFKYSIPLTSKNSSEAAKAFRKIYDVPNIPLSWPELLQCDGGREFMGETTRLT
ncbi:8889_t:CDS:2 [Paraglomus brasilianum]|uniref:8889_t:CDS:1 n=1 Tax=Paraglomus brasilianum TaxID=144538 RepID=A0A9N9AME8_9GLOM|nr:8889_t:CDS:2 [Paraglomus brasilianum]